MNTPKKPKRYSSKLRNWSKPIAINHGRFGLTNPEYAIPLGMMVSEFEHLEDTMAQFLAVVMGTPDRDQVAGYLLRSIKAPRGRYEMMKDLLELAPWNDPLGGEWDDILNEYRLIGLQRNIFVHGRWYTEVEAPHQVAFAELDEHGLSLLEAQPIPVQRLTDVVDRIRRLTTHIHLRLAYDRCQRLGLPLPPEPTPLIAKPKARPKAQPSVPPRRERKAQRKALLSQKGIAKKR